jgi:hypothetical protein
MMNFASRKKRTRAGGFNGEVAEKTDLPQEKGIEVPQKLSAPSAWTEKWTGP